MFWLAIIRALRELGLLPVAGVGKCAAQALLITVMAGFLAKSIIREGV
jgi:hypothetical protein